MQSDYRENDSHQLLLAEYKYSKLHYIYTKR